MSEIGSKRSNGSNASKDFEWVELVLAESVRERVHVSGPLSRGLPPCVFTELEASFAGGANRIWPGVVESSGKERLPGDSRLEPPNDAEHADVPRIDRLASQLDPGQTV